MRRAALAVVLLAITLPLAACGGGGVSAPDLSSIAQAADKTQSAGTARFELLLQGAGLGGQSGAAGFAAKGDVDYKNQRSRMTMDPGALAGVDDLLAQAGKGQDLSTEVIVDGKTLYLRLPLLSQLLGQGKPWLKIDAEKVAAASGQSLGDLGQIGQGDPSQALDYLKAAGDFTKVGSEQVRGVDTTHYKGTIDLSKALDEVSGPQRAQLQTLLDQSGVKELPAEAWVDGDGYLRKLTLAFSQLPASAGAGFNVTMEMFDFGADVSIEPPPSDRVADITELATKGGPTP